MTPSPRMRKVNSVIREVLADEIERLADPRLEMASVTAVDTSPDLRRAVVYISTLDLEHGPEVVETLTRAATRLQGALGRQVRMKYTPQLTFALDAGIVHGERIDDLLRNLSQDAPERKHDEDGRQTDSTDQEEE